LHEILLKHEMIGKRWRLYKTISNIK